MDAATGGGSGFDLVPDSLVGAAGGIDNIIEGIDTGGLKDVYRTCDSGSPELDSAMGSFGSQWESGMGILVGDQRSVAEDLRTVVENFLAADLASMDALHSLTHGLEQL